ncbi:hypothetical protein IJ707_04980 [bacterium]|nr:hypothetical protein [bacterium]
MSNYIVPNTFVPGTKARAQDVNENFISVQDELNTKAEKEGDERQTFLVADATEDNHAITKLQVETAIEEKAEELSDATNCFLTPFIIESGNVDGIFREPYIIGANKNILNFYTNPLHGHKPMVLIPANNQPKFEINFQLPTIDVSEYEDGTYNVFISKDKVPHNYILKNKIYKQKRIPGNNVQNNIHIDTSGAVITAKIYKGTTWEDFNDVHIGTIVVEGGRITYTKQNNFNDNGLNVNRVNQAVVDEYYSSGSSWYRLWSDGWCEQGGNVVPTAKTGTVTLLKEMTNSSDYSIICQPYYTSSAAIYTVTLLKASKSASGFSWWVNNTSYSFDWTAKGYVSQ